MARAGTVTVDLEDLKRFKRDIDTQLNGAPGPVYDAVTRWAFRYRAFAQDRFDQYSKGAGDWPAHAESTLRARRKGKGQGTPALLRDLGLLFAVLNPVFTGQPGALEERIEFGIRVGFGGNARHGDGGEATIADIASFHQTGAGVVPVREIIVSPVDSVRDDMASDMEDAIGRLTGGT